MEGVKVLAVDDDMNNLLLIQEYLEDSGYKVELASGGQEALDFLKKDSSVNAIILDWMMPEMDGIACLQHLKRHPRFRNIPVIMQTARSDSKDIANGIKEGAFQYLTKPFDEQVLISMVNAAVDEFQKLQSITESMEEQLESMKETANRLLHRKYEENISLKFDLATQSTINQFFIKSLSSTNYQDLVDLMLESVKQLQFRTSDGNFLRCSVRLNAKESTITTNDRGMESKMEELFLEQVLSEGSIVQKGTYTAVPSLSRKIAILIRNSPRDLEELQQAVDVLLILLGQFEERLTHFEDEMKLLKSNEDLENSRDQVRRIVSSCSEELHHVNENYQVLRDQQMDLLDELVPRVKEALSGELDESQEETLVQALELFVTDVLAKAGADNIADQKFLTAINKLSGLFDESPDPEAENLTPGQLADRTQESVDELLASLGL